MTTLIIGCGLVGSQVTKLEIERGERVVILDAALQVEALKDIVDPGAVSIHRDYVEFYRDIERGKA